MKLIILAWWILASTQQYVNNSWDTKVVALGPYPSKELCRMAGHIIMPSDSKFMTEKEIADRKAYYEELNKRIQDEIDATPHDKDGWAHTKHYGSYHFNKKGVQDGSSVVQSLSITSGSLTTDYTAVSACTEVVKDE